MEAAVSSVALTETCLSNIKLHNDAVNALITVTEDEALRAAEAADRAAAEGRWLGLLHGLPMVIKDCIQTAGIRTTIGALFDQDFVPNQDAEVVRRLRAAGAVLVGKANLHGLVFGITRTNPIVGQCRNPWNLDRIPGGSSGGSGVAVAAAMSIGALGTDTGGSVRIPASMNGIAGLRPTHGHISLCGITPVSSAHDTVGPMAYRVEDVARMFAVLAGYDSQDPFCRDRPLENFLPTLDRGIEGVRVGIPTNFYYENIDAEVRDAVLRGADVLKALGAEIRDIRLNGAEELHQWRVVLFTSDICVVHGERLQREPHLFSDQVRTRMRRGLSFTSLDYARAMHAKWLWQRTMRKAFEQVDVILIPTLPTEVPAIEPWDDQHQLTSEVTRFTYGGTLAGTPGLSLPCGFTSSGLPIGMLLEARPGAEPLLLRAGCAYQSQTDWHVKRPPLLPAT